MDNKKTTPAVAQDAKSEFLMELITNRNKWANRNEPGCADYAMAYERLIYAFTTPATTPKN